MIGAPRSPVRGLAALRRIAFPRPARPRCELCAADIGDAHEHLVDPKERRLICACSACAILFDHSAAKQFRRVPRDIRRLPGLRIDDALWNSFGIPIGLVFFYRSSVTNEVLAVYPSPGGPAEVEVEGDLWSELLALHPAVGALTDDVEGLLVNRIRGAQLYFLVPIDECYKLNGVIRSHWSGFTGGDQLWDDLSKFFEALEQRAIPERSTADA
jgi:hypothetical protein